MILKTTKQQEKDTPYSYILVNTALRNILMVAVIVATTVLTTLIFLELQGSANTLKLVLYTLAICAGLVFYPMSETWIYLPWQKAPQRLERHDGH